MSTVVRQALVRGARRFGPTDGKAGNRFYYKGKGGWKGGFVSRKGQFIRQDTMMKFLVVPDLEGFELKPYVAKDTPRGRYRSPDAP